MEKEKILMKKICQSTYDLNRDYRILDSDLKRLANKINEFLKENLIFMKGIFEPFPFLEEGMISEPRVREGYIGQGCLVLIRYAPMFNKDWLETIIIGKEERVKNLEEEIKSHTISEWIGLYSGIPLNDQKYVKKKSYYEEKRWIKIPKKIENKKLLGILTE